MRKTLLALALVSMPFLPGCRCPVVDSGHRGVVFKSLGGGTSREVLGEGMHIMPIWNQVIPYNLKTLDLKEKLDVISANGLSMTVDATIFYKPIPEELFELQTSLGPEFATVVVSPEVRSVARKVFGRYRPEEIYSTKREEIEQQIADEVRGALKGRHVVIEGIAIRDVVLPQEIQTAIKDKLAEEQRSQKMQFTLDRERQEATRKQVEAEGIAKYQAIVRQGLTQEYLSFKGIEATLKLAESPNAKVVVVGGGKGGLPLILQSEK